ncbi:MAG: hypothetical protein M0C28_43105 [Candidatus Moduliflexus flocculans]|nr:hypothetical protein [Candidatus Moduliflexus flocculans]
MAQANAAVDEQRPLARTSSSAPARRGNFKHDPARADPLHRRLARSSSSPCPPRSSRSWSTTTPTAP